MSEEKSVEKIEEQSADLKSLVEKNIKWSQIIYEQNKKIKYRLNLIIWGSVLKWLLILAPVIFGIVYLAPLMKPLIAQYSGLLEIGKSGVATGGLDINNIIGDLSPDQIGVITKMLGGGR